MKDNNTWISVVGRSNAASTFSSLASYQANRMRVGTFNIFFTCALTLLQVHAAWASFLLLFRLVDNFCHDRTTVQNDTTFNAMDIIYCLGCYVTSPTISGCRLSYFVSSTDDNRILSAQVMG